jgi:hypothetical protein
VLRVRIAALALENQSLRDQIHQIRKIIQEVT